MVTGLAYPEVSFPQLRSAPSSRADYIPSPCRPTSRSSSYPSFLSLLVRSLASALSLCPSLIVHRPSGGACAAMVTLDIVGLLRGWRLFDHSAHLGGAIYGIWYYFSGHLLFERLRVALGGGATGKPRRAIGA